MGLNLDSAIYLHYQPIMDGIVIDIHHLGQDGYGRQGISQGIFCCIHEHSCDPVSLKLLFIIKLTSKLWMYAGPGM